MAIEAELRCPVCSQLFKEPVRLVCAHHICMEHFGNVSRGERIACPVCGDVTVVQDNGLVVDRVLQVVVERFQQSQQHSQFEDDAGAVARSAAESGAPQLCGFCEELPATKRCVQCAGVLCEACVQTSHSRGFFKNHTILDLGVDDAGVLGADGDSRGGRAERSESTILCDVHVEEKLNFYCLDCRMPVCSHCLILGEHKGHQQTPIDQAFNTGRETLSAWLEKLSQRIAATEELVEKLRGTEVEMNRGAEAQRSIINSEMDHFRDLIETKRQQLLAKSGIEEKQKRAQLQQQVDKAHASRKEAGDLVARSESLLMINNEHAFLAVVLPLIQDMKKCAGQPVDVGPTVSCSFRPLPTDAQVRSLGDLDLGHPRHPQQQVVGQVKHMAPLTQSSLTPQLAQMASVAGANGAAGFHVAADGGQNYSIAQPQPPRYSVAGSISHMQPQQVAQVGPATAQPPGPVQYVYRPQ